MRVVSDESEFGFFGNQTFTLRFLRGGSYPELDFSTHAGPLILCNRSWVTRRTIHDADARVDVDFRYWSDFDGPGL